MAITQKERDAMDALINSKDGDPKQKKVNLVLYGDYGSWKTSTACQIGSHQGRVLHYTLDNDDDTYTSSSLQIMKEIDANTDTIKFDGGLRQLLVIAEMIAEGHYDGKNSTFVFDTIGGWVDRLVTGLATKTNYGKGTSRTVLQPRDGVNGALKFISELDLVVPEQADYNVARIRLSSIISMLFSSNLNIIINCHSRLVKQNVDKLETKEHARPDLPEGVHNLLARGVSGMIYSKKNSTGSPTFSANLGDGVSTKSRIGALDNKSYTSEKLVTAINDYLSS